MELEKLRNELEKDLGQINDADADEDEFEVYMRSINAKVQQEKEMKLKKCISEIEKVLLLL